MKDISLPMTGLLNAQMEITRRFAELLTDSMGRLSGIQLDTMEKIYRNVCQLRQEALSLPDSEQAVALGQVPKALQINVRKATDASAAYLQTAAQFQSGLIEYMRESLPGLNKQMTDGIAQATLFVKSTGSALHGDTRRKDNGSDRRMKQHA